MRGQDADVDTGAKRAAFRAQRTKKEDKKRKDRDPAICSTFTDETAPYPAMCANFNQLGFRVPFVAISPFAEAVRFAEHDEMVERFATYRSDKPLDVAVLPG